MNYIGYSIVFVVVLAIGYLVRMVHVRIKSSRQVKKLVDVAEMALKSTRVAILAESTDGPTQSMADNIRSRWNFTQCEVAPESDLENLLINYHLVLKVKYSEEIIESDVTTSQPTAEFLSWMKDSTPVKEVSGYYQFSQPTSVLRELYEHSTGKKSTTAVKTGVRKLLKANYNLTLQGLLHKIEHNGSFDNESLYEPIEHSINSSRRSTASAIAHFFERELVADSKKESEGGTPRFIIGSSSEKLLTSSG